MSSLFISSGTMDSEKPQLNFALEPMASPPAMNELPRDTIAMRRTIYGALLAFLAGFVVMLAAWAWLIARFVVPEGRWFDVLHASIEAILISFVFGGLGSAALAACLLNRYYYWRGYYCCRFCDRPLKKPGAWHDCPEAQAAKLAASAYVERENVRT